jgi:hypothetical protein
MLIELDFNKKLLPVKRAILHFLFGDFVSFITKISYQKRIIPFDELESVMVFA